MTVIAMTMEATLKTTNLGNLLLARGLERSHEVVVRYALVASRARLIAQFLIESLILSALSGCLYYTFLALETADPAFSGLSAYFDGCRMKRNSCEYDFAGGVSAAGGGGPLGGPTGRRGQLRLGLMRPG
jgi:hypothetical protein